MRHIVAVLIGAATLATAVVSVRLHHHVAQLRYRLGAMESQRVRVERELRLASAEHEAAKAPRRLMERWRELREGPVAPLRPAAPAAELPVVLPPPPPEDDGAEEVVEEDPSVERMLPPPAPAAEEDR